MSIPKTIEEIEALVSAHAAKFPQSMAAVDRSAYEEALKKYGPEKTAEMLGELYEHLAREFAEAAKIYSAQGPQCTRHAPGTCVCLMK